MPEQLAERGLFLSLNPNPHSWKFTSVSVGCSPLFYLFTPPPDRMPDHASTKCGTEPIRYMTLHFPAASRSFAPPLLKSHRKTFTVPMCQQKSCPVWFSREVPAPELSGIVRTGPKENFVRYQKKPKVIRWSWCLCWKILRPNHCFKFCFKKPS